jgi:FO synthase subunit 2
VPAERSTDYRTVRRIDPDDGPHGPTLGPRADGTPLLDDDGSRSRNRDRESAGDGRPVAGTDAGADD